jgi:hypothetical protein
MNEVNKQDKMVAIEPLPAQEPKKKMGRKPLTDEQKKQRRIDKGMAPEKMKVPFSENRKKALQKARVVKQLKAEYRHEEDEKRKNDLAVSINAIPYNKNPVPLANADLKKKIAYQNPTYGVEGQEPSLLDHNPSLRNTQQPEESDRLYQWSNSQQQQSLWSSKLTELETKMNNLDNYLSKIRVLSGEGTAGDYANPANVKQNHYIQPHNPHINPHHGPTDPSPFVPFRGMMAAKKR